MTSEIIFTKFRQDHQVSIYCRPASSPECEAMYCNSTKSLLGLQKPRTVLHPVCHDNKLKKEYHNHISFGEDSEETIISTAFKVLSNCLSQRQRYSYSKMSYIFTYRNNYTFTVTTSAGTNL